jgi:hypothetical protein
MGDPDDSRVAIFLGPSTRLFGRPISTTRLSSRNGCFAGAAGIGDMRQVRILLRSAPSRIGRRLALIVAIAAASLPSAGA